MTTATTTSVVDHTSDAGFRTWVAEFITQIVNASAVQTSDTGQINTVTVTRPGANTDGGYAIFRTPDSTLYVRIDFGTDASTTAPRMRSTWGTGSNGSGTITGQLTTTSTFTANSAPASTVLTYNSRWCVKNGYIGVSWKELAVSAPRHMGILICGVTVDSSQVITSTGYASVRQNGSTNLQMQSVRTAATASTQTESNWFSLVPGNVANSTDSSGNNQAYLWHMIVKDVQPFLWACTVVRSELGIGSTMSVAMVGATAHTYICISNGDASNAPANNGNTAYGTAMMWE